MKVDLNKYSTEALIWGLRFWRPWRHGINAGHIREFIKDYCEALRKRKPKHT